MSAATIIKSTDANVPVLSGTEGSLAALIRYIAPRLGWEIMFDNGPVIVIRPQSYKGGQALLYRFDDRAARGGAAPRVAEVRAYESMSDINTGGGLVGPVYLHKSYYANTTGYTYSVIGDTYGFFINSYLYKSGSVDGEPLSVAYCGFCNMFYSNDIPKCLLFADSVDGPSYGSKMMLHSPGSYGGSSGLYLHRNRAGVLNVTVSVQAASVMDIEGHAIGTYRSTAEWNSSKAWPSDKVIVAPIYINDGAPYSICGILPAYSRQSSLYTGYQQLSGWDGISVSAGYEAGNILVSLGDDFRP